MNITFVIGNGFDIAQGLHTRYQDFYDYYINNTISTDLIKCAIEADKKNNYKNWSDLEVALGEFTENLTENNVKKFIDCKINLDKLLISYLKEQETVFAFESNDDRLQNALKKYKISPIDSDNDKINNIFRLTSSNNYIYRAITFNYTNTLSKIWNVLKGKDIGQHKNGVNTYYKETVGDILHIHGTLNDGEMLVGVNDKTQIKNEKLRDDFDLNAALIKPLLNEYIGQNKIKKAKSIIDSSMIICLYGVSIGSTDKMWWEYIGNWLINSEHRLLIIFDYNPDFANIHPLETFQQRNSIKTKFLDLTTLSAKEKDIAKGKIIIRNNVNLFSINT